MCTTPGKHFKQASKHHSQTCAIPHYGNSRSKRKGGEKAIANPLGNCLCRLQSLALLSSRGRPEAGSSNPLIYKVSSPGNQSPPMTSRSTNSQSSHQHRKWHIISEDSKLAIKEEETKFILLKSDLAILIFIIAAKNLSHLFRLYWVLFYFTQFIKAEPRKM